MMERSVTMASLFNALAQNVSPQPQQGGMNIFQMYKNFRQTFTGDPNEILRQKIQSGEVRPEVVEQAKQILGSIGMGQRK
jgi:hypothetical protein